MNTSPGEEFQVDPTIQISIQHDEVSAGIIIKKHFLFCRPRSSPPPALRLLHQGIRAVGESLSSLSSLSLEIENKNNYFYRNIEH